MRPPLTPRPLDPQPMLLRLGRSSCWRRVAPQCAVKHRRGARSGFPANIGAAVCACAWGAPAIARREACQCQEQQPAACARPVRPCAGSQGPEELPLRPSSSLRTPWPLSPPCTVPGAPSAARQGLLPRPAVRGRPLVRGRERRVHRGCAPVPLPQAQQGCPVTWSSSTATSRACAPSLPPTATPR